ADKQERSRALGVGVVHFRRARTSSRGRVETAVGPQPRRPPRPKRLLLQFHSEGDGGIARPSTEYPERARAPRVHYLFWHHRLPKHSPRSMTVRSGAFSARVPICAATTTCGGGRSKTSSSRRRGRAGTCAEMTRSRTR